MGTYDDILAGLNKSAKTAGTNAPSNWDLAPKWAREAGGAMTRGATNMMGALNQADLWLDKKQFGLGGLVQGLPTETMTRNAQDAAGIPARPKDAGFGTDVLEEMGGSLMFPGQGLFRTPLSAVGSVTGGNIGENLGKKFDERFGTKYGATIGSFLGGAGGGVVAELPEQAGRAGLRGAFGKQGDGSRQAFSTLEGAGVTPLPALVGNDRMSKLARSMGNIPIVGGVVQNRHQNALREWQDRLFDTANHIDNGTGVTPLTRAPGEDVLGGQMRVAANAGRDNLSAQFSQKYDDFFANKPRETLVVPQNVDELRARQTNAFTGETAPTNESVQQFYDEALTPSLVAPPQGPQLPTGAPVRPGADIDNPMQGPAAPSGAPQQAGVPLDVARKIRTEAFYDAKGNRLVHGAGKQFTGAWTDDISEALMNDPAMVQRFPDPRARMAEIEQLRVIDTEYKMAKDKQVSGAGGQVEGDRLYVGGDVPAFERILNNTSDSSLYNVASKPENMSVLQRNAGALYPGLAAGNIVQKAASPDGPVGPIRTSPQSFSDYWSGRGDNQKLILTNEQSPGNARSMPGPQQVQTAMADPNLPRTPEMQQTIDTATAPTPIRDQLDTLSDAGDLFREAKIKSQPNDGTQTATTLGLIGAGVYDPFSAAMTLGLSKALGHAASSPALARIIAGLDPSMRSVFADQLISASARRATHDTVQPEPAENTRPY